MASLASNEELQQVIVVRFIDAGLSRNVVDGALIITAGHDTGLSAVAAAVVALVELLRLL